MTASTSSLLRKTQFTYKTFRCIELLKYSRCCQLSNFCCVFTGLEKRVMGSREHMHQFCFLCTQHGGRVILHSNVSVGYGEMEEPHAVATSFIRATKRETRARTYGENVTFSTL